MSPEEGEARLSFFALVGDVFLWRLVEVQRLCDVSQEEVGSLCKLLVGGNGFDFGVEVDMRFSIFTYLDMTVSNDDSVLSTQGAHDSDAVCVEAMRVRAFGVECRAAQNESGCFDEVAGEKTCSEERQGC